MSAHVVDDCLDDVWLGEGLLVKVGDNRAPNVVKGPSIHCSQLRIQTSFGLGPPLEAARTITEKMLAFLSHMHAGKYLQARIRQRHEMGAPVLRALWRQLNQPLLGIHLGSLQFADLGAALTCQQEKSNDTTVVVIVAGIPDGGDLGLGKHPSARDARRPALDMLHRVAST